MADKRKQRTPERQMQVAERFQRRRESALSRPAQSLGEAISRVPSQMGRNFADRVSQEFGILGSAAVAAVRTPGARFQAFKREVSQGIRGAIADALGSGQIGRYLADKVRSGIRYDKDPQKNFEQLRLGLVAASQDFQQIKGTISSVNKQTRELALVVKQVAEKVNRIEREQSVQQRLFDQLKQAADENKPRVSGLGIANNDNDKASPASIAPQIDSLLSGAVGGALSRIPFSKFAKFGAWGLAAYAGYEAARSFHTAAKNAPKETEKQARQAEEDFKSEDPKRQAKALGDLTRALSLVGNSQSNKAIADAIRAGASIARTGEEAAITLLVADYQRATTTQEKEAVLPQLSAHDYKTVQLVVSRFQVRGLMNDLDRYNGNEARRRKQTKSSDQNSDERVRREGSENRSNDELERSSGIKKENGGSLRIFSSSPNTIYLDSSKIVVEGDLIVKGKVKVHSQPDWAEKAFNPDDNSPTAPRAIRQRRYFGGRAGAMQAPGVFGKASSVSLAERYARFGTDMEKQQFLAYGQLPRGFENVPGHMGILGSPGAVMARGVMPLGQFGGGGVVGGYGGMPGGGYSGAAARSTQADGRRLTMSQAAIDPNVQQALSEVAGRYGISPEAISRMINLESKWNTRQQTGSYRGLTQIGPVTFREAGGKLGGLTFDQFVNASPSDQIRAYGDYLKHYKFQEQASKHGVDFSRMSVAQQAAYLQGMQFAPNAQKWKQAFAAGNYNVPVTGTRQARALGNTSIADMTRYYERYDTEPGTAPGTAAPAPGAPTPATAPSAAPAAPAPAPAAPAPAAPAPVAPAPVAPASAAPPAKFNPNDPIGSLTNVRNPKNSRLAGRLDPQGTSTESEFYSDMVARKGSPFNYALTDQGQREFGNRARNIMTITTNSGKRLSVNQAAAGDFKQFIDEIEARGYKIESLHGFSNRNNRNAPGKASTHAFGAAIDINPDQNPNKPRIAGQTDMPENIKYVAMKYGLAQIGSDRMHFERVSPAMRKVYVQRLIQQGWIKPDDPVVRQRIREGVITQEEVNNIKITPIVPQPAQPAPAAPGPAASGTPLTEEQKTKVLEQKYTELTSKQRSGNEDDFKKWKSDYVSIEGIRKQAEMVPGIQIAPDTERGSPTERSSPQPLENQTEAFKMFIERPPQIKPKNQDDAKFLEANVIPEQPELPKIPIMSKALSPGAEGFNSPTYITGLQSDPTGPAIAAGIREGLNAGETVPGAKTAVPASTQASTTASAGSDDGGGGSGEPNFRNGPNQAPSPGSQGLGSFGRCFV